MRYILAYHKQFVAAKGTLPRDFKAAWAAPGRELMFEFAEPKNAIEGIADAAFFSV